MKRGTIRLSPRGRATYQLLSLVVALLLLYGAGFMAAALAQLPSDPLAGRIEPSVIERLSGRVFQLTMLCALAAAGLMMAGDRLSNGAAPRLRRIWTALAGASVALSPFEFGLALDLAAALALLYTLHAFAVSARPGEISGRMRVWQLGLLLIAISGGAHLLEGRALDAMRAFQLHAAYPLAWLGVMFWLMGRYSRVDDEWAEDGARIVGLLVFLAGGLISLGRLGLPAPVSLGATPLIALSYIILAGHSYRALSSRDENASLAPHWIALATLFWLVGGGFLGALSIQPAINEAVRGTALADAQDWLARWTLLAIALALVNESAAALRGGNRRVTGFVPLWLCAFGAALAGITQACLGVAQIYLRAAADVAPAALAERLLPLTLVWLICLSAVAAGIVSYALGFWLRRPRIRVDAG